MRKKLFAILMSAMMMVTFMPSMAFAEAGDSSETPSPKEISIASENCNHDFYGLSGEVSEDALTTAKTAKKVTELTKAGNTTFYKVECSADACKAYTIVHVVDEEAGECTHAKTITTEMTAEEYAEYVSEYESAQLAQLFEDNLGKDVATINNRIETFATEMLVFINNNISKSEGNIALPNDASGNAFRALLMEKIQAAFRPYVSYVENLAAKASEAADAAEKISLDGGEETRLANVMAKVAGALQTLISQYIKGVSLVAGEYKDAKEAAAPLDSAEHSNACKFLVTTCKACGEVQATRAIAHKAPERPACATQYECTECHKIIKIQNESDKSFDDFKLVEAASKALDIAKNFDSYFEENTFKKDEFTDDFREIERLLIANDSSVLEQLHKYGPVKVNHTECGDSYVIECEKCGEKLASSYIPNLKAEHKWETVVLKAPECCDASGNATEGLSVEQCSVCGAYNLASFKPIPATHTYVTETVKPTCSTPGYTVELCKECGAFKQITDVVPATGHNYNEKRFVQELTCEGPALYEIKCTNANCGKSHIFVGSGDNDTEYYVDGEEQEGFKTHIVEDLGDINQAADLYDIMQNNNFVSVLAGSKVKSTYFLGFNVYGLPESLINKNVKPIEVESMARTHEWATWTEAVPANCEHGAIWARTCASCGPDMHAVAEFIAAGYKSTTELKEKVVEVGEKLEHAYDTQPVGPTCTDKGYTYMQCSACKKCIVPAGATAGKLTDLSADQQAALAEQKVTVIYNVTAATGHTVATKTEDPTCEKEGYSYDVCADCGAFLSAPNRSYKPFKVAAIDKYDITRALGHTPSDEWTTVKDSTFAEVGTRVLKCTKCGEICEYDDVAFKTLAKAEYMTLKGGKKSFTAKTKKATKYADGYQIKYKVAGKNNYKTKTFAATDGKISVKITGLKKGKKYAVKVRAYAKRGDDTIYGAWSGVKYVKTKKK